MIQFAVIRHWFTYEPWYRNSGVHSLQKRISEFQLAEFEHIFQGIFFTIYRWEQVLLLIVLILIGFFSLVYSQCKHRFDWFTATLGFRTKSDCILFWKWGSDIIYPRGDSDFVSKTEISSPQLANSLPLLNSVTAQCISKPLQLLLYYLRAQSYKHVFLNVLVWGGWKDSYKYIS